MPRNCGSVYTYDHDHVSPFLTELNISSSGGVISVNPVFWRAQPTIAGTGINTSDPNSFMTQGLHFSNGSFSSVATVRDPSAGSTDIVLNTPVWNTFKNRLNIKTVHADQFGQIPGGCPTEDVCNTRFNLAWPSQNTIIANVTPEPYVSTPRNMTNAVFLPDQILDCVNNGYFRGIPTAVATTTAQALAVSIFPNPATDYMQVSLTGYSSSEGIAITLTDLTGKNLGTLYEGQAAGLTNARLAVGNQATGTYQLSIYSKGVLLKSALVTIAH